MRYFMRRILTVLALLSFFAIAFPAAAQSLPSKKEAAALMQKAFADMDLTSPGSPPFHLIAHVHYELAGDGRDGIYELFWSAPDRWREGFEMERVDPEIDWALGDKLYTLRGNPSASLPLLRVRAVLHSGRSDAFAWNLKVNRVTSEQLNGDQVTCISSKQDPIEEHACLDSGNNLIESVRDQGQAGWTAYLNTERSNFKTLAGKRYPTHYISHYFDENMDIKIQTVALANDAVERVFTPQPGALASDWCATPVEKGETSPGYPELSMHKPALIAYYLLVARDGKVKTSVPLRPADPNYDAELNGWFRNVKFPTKSCGSNPVEYERLFYLPSNLR
jgi:hypothetical protein